MLGETPELFRETAEWVKSEVERIEKNENAKRQGIKDIQPLLDEKRERILSKNKK